ncbi:PDR/VanB family oxidoreductase [Hydrogenophaga laconesensis]|uniref:Vanillate O-demethylase ferredoxin subunit n=1 Tax=Hydrogenophaga laconesensis TaxID=1805971 RepID=A0ABU1V517_9BURK|nr:PDR/VanB family oxidoreductase [Hydrogenophaga laconesensis]MDR7092535.1 vanillate O-demethylase ferredoxin subunit [Hydrogenophaga laconesensis]
MSPINTATDLSVQPNASNSPVARGDLTIRVTRVVRHTDEINSYVLQRIDGLPLPACEAGAHVDVHLPGGLVRSYSLCGDPTLTTEAYEIAVKREDSGRGGSRAMHMWVREGEILRIGMPRNHFRLAHDAPHHLLLGGGIGVTPLVSMAHALHALGAPFTLAVFARSARHLALSRVLDQAPWRGNVQVHFDDVPSPTSPATLVANAPAGSHAYFCGPEGFMTHVRNACQAWPAERVHFEYFSAPVKADAASARSEADVFEVVLARRQQRLQVPAGKSIAQVLQGAGVAVDTVCEQGICGSCLTPYLSGTPDHQDTCMTEAERATHVAVCCARSHSPTLTLDL